MYQLSFQAQFSIIAVMHCFDAENPLFTFDPDSVVSELARFLVHEDLIVSISSLLAQQSLLNFSRC